MNKKAILFGVLTAIVIISGVFTPISVLKAATLDEIQTQIKAVLEKINNIQTQINSSSIKSGTASSTQTTSEKTSLLGKTGQSPVIINTGPAFFQNPSNTQCRSILYVRDVPFEWRRVEKCSNEGIDLTYKHDPNGVIPHKIEKGHLWFRNAPFTISYWVTNIGGKATDSFKVNLWVSGDKIAGNDELCSVYKHGTPDYHCEEMIGTQVVEGLAPNETIKITFNDVSYSKAQTHQDLYIFIQIDPDNQIAETNEDNNQSPAIWFTVASS